MSRIRVAAVGLGWVATHRHLPVMERSDQYQVVGVIDRSPGRAAEVRRKRGYAHFAQTDRLFEIEWLREVDAITVATAPMSHYSVIRQGLELGKHVITEKPFTMTVAEGEDLLARARAAGRQLAVVHNFQFARSTKRLLQEMESGRIGAIRSVSAIQLGNPGRRLPAWYEQLPLGLMYDESPHLLYLIRRMAGEVELRRCLTYPSTLGANTPARLDAFFASPQIAGPVTLSCNFESPVSEWYLMVFGEHRLGIVDVFRDIYVSLPNDGTHNTRTVIRTSLAATVQHWAQHVISGIPHLTGGLYYGNEEVFRRFALAVGGDTQALKPIDGESALAVLRLQHAIVERQESAVQEAGVRAQP